MVGLFSQPTTPTQWLVIRSRSSSICILVCTYYDSTILNRLNQRRQRQTNSIQQFFGVPPAPFIQLPTIGPTCSSKQRNDRWSIGPLSRGPPPDRRTDGWTCDDDDQWSLPNKSQHMRERQKTSAASGSPLRPPPQFSATNTGATMLCLGLCIMYIKHWMCCEIEYLLPVGWWQIWLGQSSIHSHQTTIILAVATD